MELWGPYKWEFPKNGGTQQPWVFLLKMIITWGVVFGGKTYHLRKHPYCAENKWLLTGGFFVNPSNRSCRLRNERPNQQPLGRRKSSTCHCWVDLWGSGMMGKRWELRNGHPKKGGGYATGMGPLGLAFTKGPLGLEGRNDPRNLPGPKRPFEQVFGRLGVNH